MTLLDIAKQLRLSKSTISRALNPATAHLISGPVRERIQKYAIKVHFTPNRSAQELTHGMTHTVGVVLITTFNSLFFNDYVPKVLSGVYAVLDQYPQYGCKLIVITRGKSLSDADQYVLNTGVDGLLVSTFCDYQTDQLLNFTSSIGRRWKKPLVALNTNLNLTERMSTVSFSNYEAAYKAMLHLIKNGHQEIGLIYADIGSPDDPERIRAYKEALADHKLMLREEHMQRGDFSPESGYEAALRLFKQPHAKKLTAVFCTNDEMSIGVIRALKTLRKRCPQDIAVMGFDGLTLGDFIEPRLSTIPQPSHEMARAGTQLLMDMIEKRQKVPVHLTIPTDLLIRESA